MNYCTFSGLFLAELAFLDSLALLELILIMGLLVLGANVGPRLKGLIVYFRCDITA